MQVEDRFVRFHWIDWTVVLTYLAALIVIGIYQSRKEKTVNEYFLAGRKMKWLPIGLSLMAALTSAGDYLGQPSAMIQYGPMILAGVLSWLILYPYVFYIILPFYRKLGIYTVYEYLEIRFDSKVRTLAAGIYLVWQILLLGVCLYVPCLAMVAATNQDDLLIPLILVLGVVATTYTALGGMKGVIWGGVMQSAILFTALAIQVGLLWWNVDGGLKAIAGNIHHVGIYNKPFPETTSFSDWIKEYFIVPYTVFGMFWLTTLGRINTFTCNQQIIQRFETASSIKDARRSFLLMLVGDSVSITLLSLMGVAYFAYYSTDGRLPEVLAVNPDKVVPWFISDIFPIGLTGLIIASLWAVGLSAFSGLLNSICTVAVVDFAVRIFPHIKATDESSRDQQRFQVLISRVLTFILGLVAIVIASNAMRMGKLIDIMMGLSGSFMGPILGIFLFAIFVPRANSHGVFWGGLIGSVVGIYSTIWTAPGLYQEGAILFPIAFCFPDPEIHRAISKQWIGTLGLIGMAFPTLLISLLTSPEPEKSTNTWWNLRKKD